MNQTTALPTQIEPAPPLSVQRAAIGLRTPVYEDKLVIWEGARSSTAGVDGYKPTYNLKLAHQADARGVGISGGWRSGKSLASAMETLTWLADAELVWFIAEDYELSRMEFIYLGEAAMSTGLAREKDVHIPKNKYQPCYLTSITGCLVETKTLANVAKLAAKAPDFIVVCEPGIIDNLSLVMEILWGRVSQKRGGILLAGTSDESSEEWYEQWSRWSEENIEGGKSFEVPTWQNTYAYPAGRNERELLVYLEMYGQEAFDAHYGGKPASPRNVVLRGYWNRAMHISEDAVFDKKYPVEVAIDPNYSLGHRYAVEVMQWDPLSGKEWICDEIAEEGLTHPEIINLCKAREWWPHIRGGTIDPYAGESHIYGSPAPVTYWDMLDLRTDHRPKVNTTVQALKESLKGVNGREPLAVNPKAKRFIYEASRWRQMKTGKPSDTMCDATKAAGYWLVDRRATEKAIARAGEDNTVRATDWGFDEPSMLESSRYAS